MNKSWALPDNSIKKTHNMWRTSMYTNVKNYGGSSSVHETSNDQIVSKVAALKKSIASSKAAAKQRNEDWLKRRMEELNVVEKRQMNRQKDQEQQ